MTVVILCIKLEELRKSVVPQLHMARMLAGVMVVVVVVRAQRLRRMHMLVVTIRYLRVVVVVVPVGMAVPRVRSLLVVAMVLGFVPDVHFVFFKLCLPDCACNVDEAEQGQESTQSQGATLQSHFPNSGTHCRCSNLLHCFSI